MRNDDIKTEIDEIKKQESKIKQKHLKYEANGSVLYKGRALTFNMEYFQ